VSDDKIKRDRSTLLRMAGNIASGLATRESSDQFVAKRAVAIAKAILEEIDGPPHTPGKALP
jgi:hypothetical protein